MDTSPDALVEQALQAREHAYAPYSGFRVGAALRARDGRLFHGCNVENASLGLCCCAERNALFQAVAAGYAPRSFAAMAVVAAGVDPVTPCGACRQVLLELGGPDLELRLGNLDGALLVLHAADLLPLAFALPTEAPTRST